MHTLKKLELRINMVSSSNTEDIRKAHREGNLKNWEAEYTGWQKMALLKKTTKLEAIAIDII